MTRTITIVLLAIALLTALTVSAMSVQEVDANHRTRQSITQSNNCGGSSSCSNSASNSGGGSTTVCINGKCTTTSN